MNDLIGSNPCPECHLCNSQGKLIHEKLTDRLFSAPGEWNLVKCINIDCGLVWLDPMPSPEDISKAYRTYYTHEASRKGESFISKSVRSAYRVVKSIPSYLLGRRGDETSIENMYLNDTKPGRLLDVGCGSGTFLNKMKLIGWEVEGVDFDQSAVDVANEEYGIKVSVGDLESVNYAANSFDAVTISHVVEHVHEPSELIKECYRILKPQGSLIITTPNVDSWGHQKYSRHWRGLEPPRHLHLFSPKTLKACAVNAGFQNVRTHSTAAYSSGIFIESINAESNSLINNANLRKLKQSTVWVSLMLQSYEFLKIDKYPNSGEIAVAICQK